jgi:hypothetical protein
MDSSEINEHLSGAYSWHLTEKREVSAKICVAVGLELSLQQHCALELYSGFIDAIASKVREIGHQTEFRRAEGDSLAQNPAARRSNFVLDRISQFLVEEGLVNNMKEAKAVVIPSFAQRGLLPTREGSVIFETGTKKEASS